MAWHSLDQPVVNGTVFNPGFPVCYLRQLDWRRTSWKLIYRQPVPSWRLLELRKSTRDQPSMILKVHANKSSSLEEDSPISSRKYSDHKRDIRASLILYYLRLMSFQADAVNDFLKHHPPPFTDGQFNNSGNVSFVSWDFSAIFFDSLLWKARAIPDVAANGYVILS